MLAAYLGERFKPGIFGPAAAVLTAAALWAVGTGVHATSVVATLGLAVMLLLQFRLWDDLEDLERDRRSHPARVLVRADPAPFRLACVVLGAANIVALMILPSRVAAESLACLDLFFWLSYGPLRPRLSDRVWRFQILLLKYPAFVGVLASAVGAPIRLRLIAAALLVYLCACAYEASHNRHIPFGATP